MKIGNGRETASKRWRPRWKMVAAATLSVIFIGVIFAVPSEKLAWQGPLVMGTLALPKPNPAKVYRVESREATESLLSFLGFLSVVGVLGLAGKKLLPGPPPAGTPPVKAESSLAAMAAAHPGWPFF